MIKQFAHKGLENFFLTGSKAGIQANHATKLRLLLATLNAATTAKAMDLPAWRLHALAGDLKGHWSVWVNGNWRLTFKMDENGDARIVNYQDYH